MSCPEIVRVLAIIKPENRAKWERVYNLCYRAVCTPSLDAPVALDVLIDHMIEIRQWTGFCSVTRARNVAYLYAARRCGMRLSRSHIPKKQTRCVVHDDCRADKELGKACLASIEGEPVGRKLR